MAAGGGSCPVACTDAAMEEGAGSPGTINPFDMMPEEIWEEIFKRVPHVSRLHCRCVCSKWERFLKPQQQSLKPGPVCGLALQLALPVGGQEGEEAVQGGLQCLALQPIGAPPGQLTSSLPVGFPPGWRPDANVGGGLRAGGCLVAFFCNGHYWVGNPVHDKWEKVLEPMELRSLPFGKTSFELVVDPAEQGGRYLILAFGVNDWPARPRQPLHPSRDHHSWTRDHHNWVNYIYCSRARTWRRGASLDRWIFRELCDFCVAGRMVYFVGWVTRARDLRSSDENCRVEEEMYYWRMEVWGYDLDNDRLSVIVPGEQISGIPQDFDTYSSSMRLHVFDESGQQEASSSSSHGQLEEFNKFSITIVAARQPRVGHEQIARDRIYRLVLLKQEDTLGSQRTFWCVNSEAGLDELTRGGPSAALVADNWGLSSSLVAYLEYELFNVLQLRPQDWTMRILCYKREEEKWVEWHIQAPKSEWVWEVPAVAFLPCECCGHLTVSGDPSLRTLE